MRLSFFCPGDYEWIEIEGLLTTYLILHLLIHVFRQAHWRTFVLDLSLQFKVNPADAPTKVDKNCSTRGAVRLQRNWAFYLLQYVFRSVLIKVLMKKPASASLQKSRSQATLGDLIYHLGCCSSRSSVHFFALLRVSHWGQIPETKIWTHMSRHKGLKHATEAPERVKTNCCWWQRGELELV